MAFLSRIPWKDYLRRGWKRFLEQSRQSASYLPSLKRKPALLWQVVKTASLFHAVAITCLLTLLFLAPPVAKGIAGIFHAAPKGALGVLQKQNPQAESLKSGILTLWWLGSGALCLLLLWWHLPGSMASMARASGRSERQADGLAAGDPDKSLKLYLRALDLAADPRDEATLHEKIRILLLGSPHLNHTYVSHSGASRSGITARKVVRTVPKTEKASDSVVGQDGRYRLDHPLGQGGMGSVYAGFDTRLGRTVAIKGLPEGPDGGQDFSSRFHQEAKALAALCHPAIVQVYDLVLEHGRIWIVLEYVEGGDLAVHLRQHGRLPIQEVARLGRLSAEALQYAHRQGVVHRDFKPANVLLTLDRAPKITDFGLARLAGNSALTRTGTILGSAFYMSPEQATGKVADYRADIYSLGVTLFELASGKTPFVGDPATVLAQHITQQAPFLCERCPQAPAELGTLLQRMLIKDPESRLSDLSEVINLLRELESQAGAPKRAARTRSR